MLPAQYRMRRSADFGATVRYGQRAVQPDIVIHSRRLGESAAGPLVGLIIAKSVGSAVQRHQVARRLRHVARGLLADLERSEQLVIRARPGSSQVESSGLAQQLRVGLRRIGRLRDADR